MKIKIIRIDLSNDGTFGVLLIEGKVFCLTLELPWLQNKPNISCIPKGSYTCTLIKSLKYGLTYRVDAVENRSGILFHSGNTIHDSKGCILLGASYGTIGDKKAKKRAVLDSRNTVAAFMKKLRNVNAFALEIV